MTIRQELIEACHKVYEKGFVAAYDGNLSARLSEERILITPSAKCKGEVEEHDLLEIDLDGHLLEGHGKVSTEVKIHLLAYRERPDVNSVIHCHPVYSTAFASSRGEGFGKPVFPEVILSLGKVPLCKYGTPSTDELPDSIRPHIHSSWAFLLENHGAVTIGRSVKEAYFKMEKLEHAAQTLYIARTLGGEKPLSGESLKKLYDIAERVYGLKLNK
ncbi:MAG: class II aldolase/adducin family protein [Bacteroidota bacterium]|jgi:L-fuculose-phosphate aldolase|nr:class II aldolase/adducin family protein [Ignavibacteria bacterium]HEX2963788.1 class II aldolase/adducin family protein [Ignavibacteriales bacterium]MCU7499430.1 class II aldolase/adducin family protein [Ignavibacteria bacterium]MCU7512738.1 class II aldolase/adducin family protein [Ignavibacteria bacterium]MCU7522638.1 class II aldolase/adducin family protein [Ignavibacteria bacterium]